MSRFEIVRTEAGWHARFVAANHKIVFVTENYTRRGAAIRAIASLSRPMNAVPTSTGVRTLCRHYDHSPVVIRDVDEREVQP